MSQQCNIRINIILYFLLTIFICIILYFYHLQITQYTFFQQLAYKQHNTIITESCTRAHIIDRNNKLLAINKDSTSAFFTPQNIHDKDILTTFLINNFPDTIQRWKKNSNNHFIYIKRKLSDEEKQNIINAHINDIYFLTEPQRFYPYDANSSIIGITDIDNEGLFGIELSYNNHLKGKPTKYNIEKDARSNNHYFSKKIIEPGIEGQTIKLSIDSILQFLMQEELKNTMQKFNAIEGAIIVMDPTNGHILSMVSEPSFNPNNTYNINIKTTKNYAITESYEFGSAFKVLTGLAALEEAIVTPEELIDCENLKTTYVDGRKINTVHAAGIISFAEVIQTSNNIGIAKIAKRLQEKLYYHYKKMGFGNKTGIPLNGEQSGFINPPHLWSKQSIISLSYGYEISSTLLQLTRAFCMLANDGYKIDPILILEPHQKTVQPQKIYSTKTINTMKKILHLNHTVTGTGKYGEIPGYYTYGKTSTANLLVNGQYVPEKNLYGFIGGIENGDYKRIIGCFIKESSQKNIYAATVAAPLFKSCAEKLIIHERA